MKYMFFLLFLVWFITSNSQNFPNHLATQCSLCSNSKILTSKSNNESVLLARPIQENYLIFQSRPETIKLKVDPQSNVDRVIGIARYLIGSGGMSTVQDYELVFKDDGLNGDEIANDGIFTSHKQLELLYEEWVQTYKVTTVGLRLSFFKGNQEVESADVTHAISLNYLQFNSNFFASLKEPEINVLNDQGTVVHLGNSVYLDYERIFEDHSDNELNFHTTPFDMVTNIEGLLDEVWGERVLVEPREGIKGLNGLNSTAYSISLTGLSGNTHSWFKKAGQTSMQVLLTTGTLNHELLHQYFPLFFHDFDEKFYSPLRGLGRTFINHLPVLFTGQSGFATRGPYSSSAYSVFCPEDYDLREDIDGGWGFYIDSECVDSKLEATAINGISKDIHSAFELYLMRIGDIEKVDFPVRVGFGAERKNIEGSNDREWTVRRIVELSRNDLESMRETWYNRSNGIYQDHFDGATRNILFFFNGSGQRTYEEYKMMHFISDELTKDELQIEVPSYHEFGVGGYYDRYLSYSQSTQGLGKLTNDFPLPKGFQTTSTNEIDHELEFVLYPNPTQDRVYIKNVIPDKMNIIDASGTVVVSSTKTKEIDISSLVSGLYFIQVWRKGRVTTKKLIKF